MAQVSAQKAAALQVGYSREYLVKLVGAEQKRRDDEEGIQYEYNTEVLLPPCACIKQASMSTVK